MAKDGQAACCDRGQRSYSPQAAHIGWPCSQGGVKVPTGGKGEVTQARERLFLIWLRKRVSRFGVIPKPTVKVRMKENGRDSRCFRAARRSVCPDSGPCLLYTLTLPTI